MKNHIAVKFIAVFLAALALFGAIGSAVGIICLTAADLYQQSVTDLYEGNMEATRQNLAMHLVHQYASLKLGNLPEDYFYDYWGSQWMYDNFQYGYYFYNILDENGQVVESTVADMPEGTTLYTHEVTDIRYKHLFGILSGDVTYSVIEGTDPTADTEETTIPETTLAVEETQVGTPTTAPESEVDETLAEDSTTVTATDESLSETDSDIMVAQIEPSVRFEDEIYNGEYYDSGLGRMVEFTYYYDDLPTYTVELYLLPGAVTVEPVWELLELVWNYRYDLFYLLGISLLVFAVMAVYLCCSAGRKPGREEIRPGGFNCIPLDLYAAVGGTGICLIFVLGLEVVDYLLRNSPDVLLPFVLVAGYGCCLLLIGFCFACAAQFKTPGGYWWRNTLIARCCRLVIFCWNWLIDLCVRFFKWLGPVCKKLLRACKRLILAAFRLLEKGLTWLVQLLCRLVRKLYRFIIWFVPAAFRQVERFLTNCFRKLFRAFNRFISLLPLTWQWLLTSAALLFLAYIAFNTYSEGWMLLCLGAFVGIVLYASHCFGILMESAKRMGKGDLETKVSDQFLVGSFKEFAGDLNALADVAVVAAQKQMKSERMKTELITNVSHDIKTPLTSIINYVDLLEKPHTPEEEAEYLEVLSRQSQRMKKLVEDLMEMSKASTGNLTVDITAVNAGEAINQALGEFADKLDKAQLIPVFRQPEEALYMKADGRLVWRVMSNLLSNAVKYALPGTRLYIDLLELEGKVVISMKNISREELNVSADELLERFVRGDASRNTEGSGLGLNIAKSLMEVQKGQLQLLVDGDLFKVTLVFPAVRND